MKTQFTVVGLLSIWVCGICIQRAMPIATESAESAQDFEVYENKASASLVGEFRSSLSSYLWDKSDEYLHSGVRIRAMTKNEISNNNVRQASSSDGLQSHHNETSVIPAKENDPRWLWGDIERSVRPWFDVRGHKHRNPEETIPLFRFMTWIDPHFIPGYLVGANVILFSGKERTDEAMRFIFEGIRNNPSSVALNTEYARYLISKQGKLEAALPYLLNSLGIATKKKLSEAEAIALNDTYRWLVLAYRNLGKIDLARNYARNAITLFPNDPVFENIISGSPIKEETFSPESEEHHH